jgi:dihydroorotate dehydrogenase electron transfer subunit
MPGIFHLTLEAEAIAKIARPGQFVMLTCDSGSQRLLRRPISIHRVENDRIELLYAVIGEGTRWLSQRPTGETLDILGPAGNGFTIEGGAGNLLLVAGGMGSAPMSFLAASALAQNKSVKMLAGAKTASLIIPERLLPQGLIICTATEDGSKGQKGLITDLLLEQTEWADQIFICGPLPMFKAIYKNYFSCLQNKDVQVSLEVRMGCGLGFCYACTIKTQNGLKQVCKDGPVFYFQDIIWDELK